MAEDEVTGNSRKMRARCRNRMFSEDMWLVSKDEDDMGGRKAYYVSYNLPDKLKNPKYAGHGYVKELNGYNFTMEYLDRTGFCSPLLIDNKHSLALKVPDSGFGVNDVRRCVGSDRIVDVIDVNNQKDVQMSMKEYQKYFENHDKDVLYNVISLEFSHTKLDHHVMQPSVVRKLDWVDLYWPRSLKNKQMDSTNVMKNMMYPKVQKYCLMSVKGCYTDFHVDFGGTSVWYHILKGVKVFWLIRPTDENLSLYRNWLLLDKRLNHNRNTFLGDAVDKCERVVLRAGQTFFIPSGWLHAVYTVKDSLVFGGNFLHTYSTDMQIKISRLEDDTRVTKKFRYPYFTEMHWYALDGIVRRLVRTLDLNPVHPSLIVNLQNAENVSTNNLDYQKLLSTMRTARLLKGMKNILDYLTDLPDARRDVPEGMHDHEELLKDARCLYENYKTVLDVSCLNDPCFEFPDNGYPPGNVGTFKRKSNAMDKKVKKFKSILISEGVIYRKHTYRRRRTRCRTCEACCKEDCGTCVYCKDMIKYGGNGRAKQSCIMRQCLRPVLPSNSVCVVCRKGNPIAADDVLKPDASVGLDNRRSTVKIIQAVIDTLNQCPATPVNFEEDNLLMECAICYEIVHPRCVFNTTTGFDKYDIANNVNDDLSNSWKCPKCFAKKGNDEEFFNKQRFFKARSKVLNQGKQDGGRDQDDDLKDNDGSEGSSREDLAVIKA